LKKMEKLKQMKKVTLLKLASAAMAAGFSVLFATDAPAAFIPLGRTNYFQNFDSLVSAGKSTTLPLGWAMTYGSDRDVSIFADNGSGTMGRIYSYGANGSSDRAMGSLRQAGMSPSQTVAFGANFQNASGSAMNRLNISYTGEEWRLGAQGRGPDRLQFQYSLNANSLTSGSWINVPGLDFLTPNLIGVGAHNGNLAANQTAIAGSIGFLNIPIGANFWIRWVDMALPGGGPEDGLGVDNLTVSAIPEASTVAAGIGLTALLGYAFLRQVRGFRALVNLA
jgi:hypothetical protein